jgi:hypothetical protein
VCTLSFGTSSFLTTSSSVIGTFSLVAYYLHILPCCFILGSILPSNWSFAHMVTIPLHMPLAQKLLWYHSQFIAVLVAMFVIPCVGLLPRKSLFFPFYWLLKLSHFSKAFTRSSFFNCDTWNRVNKCLVVTGMSQSRLAWVPQNGCSIMLSI